MSDPFGLMRFAECEHKTLLCVECHARSNIIGWQTFTGQDKELLRLREENEQLTQRFKAAKSQRDQYRKLLERKESKSNNVRCPICNTELSYCGTPNEHGPTLDCLVCQLRQTLIETKAKLAEHIHLKQSLSEIYTIANLTKEVEDLRGTIQQERQLSHQRLEEIHALKERIHDLENQGWDE